MTTRIADIIDGEVTEDHIGFRHRRWFLLDGVTGAGHARTYNAVNFGQIPRVGDLHPSIPGIVVLNKRAAPVDDPSIYRVEVNYGSPELAGDAGAGLRELGDTQIRMTSATTEERRITDVNGARMKTVYSTAGAAPIQQFFTANVEYPTLALSVERVESARGRDIAKEFTGAVNAGAWNGFAAKTWLCTGIESREFRLGLFVLTYEFQYRDSAWEFVPFYEANGIIPADAIFGNGIARFDVYETRDFGRLRINW